MSFIKLHNHGHTTIKSNLIDYQVSLAEMENTAIREPVVLLLDVIGLFTLKLTQLHIGLYKFSSVLDH